jgi:predicted nucleotidyltransferase
MGKFMLTQEEIEKNLKECLPFLKRQFKVNKIGLFGSFVHGEENPNSDVDLLVDYDPSIGWDVFELQEFLAEKFGRKVDLVSIRALKPQLKDRILSEVVYI